jgi:hypothetical protein
MHPPCRWRWPRAWRWPRPGVRPERAVGDGRRGRARAGPRCCATRFRGRDRLRPGPDHRPVLAHGHGQHLRVAADLRLPGAAGPHQAPDRGGHARGQRDFRRFVFRIRPGIHFADDPAFKGQRRELVAADYVYSIKRYYDPRYKSPTCTYLENAKACWACRSCAAGPSPTRSPSTTTREVEGLRALDRYTFEVRAGQARRRASLPADPALRRGGARGGRGHPGDKAMEHPVGTGPSCWRSGSAARASCWSATPATAISATTSSRRPATPEAAGDRRGWQGPRCRWSTASSRHHRGAQPRWLAFLNGEHDLERLPNEFARGRPNGQLAPNLARAASSMGRVRRWPTRPCAYFGMEHPVVGGYTAATRWRCAAPSRWPTTWSARSPACAGARRCRRSLMRPSCPATTRPGRAR